MGFRLRAAGMLALVCSIAATLLGTAIAPASAAPALSTSARSFAHSNLASLMARSSKSDPRYYSAGVWHTGSSTCFRCALGPAVESAVQGVTAGDRAATKVAITSFDIAIRGHRLASGAFGPWPKGEGGPDIQTSLFASELAETYLILGSKLDASHKRSWSAALAGAADFLIRNGNLRWYTNGNIVLANALVMDLTYRITKAPRFRSAAATALKFAMTPPQSRWKGFGLHYTKVPKKADGSDGSAYFTESGGGKPGFDAAYTLAQINVVSFWYLLTNNPTARRLANLLTNQMLPRVRTSDWTVDISGGTRHVKRGVRWGFYVSSISVLAARAGRKDLAKYVAGQTKVLFKNYQGATTYANEMYSYTFGSELAPILYVQSRTKGW
ncbi:MAG: hypothetical protein JWN95_3572 [Frankiales bacterium]|nr:hypothetical protein [Frankiales bacterium]